MTCNNDSTTSGWIEGLVRSAISRASSTMANKQSFTDTQSANSTVSDSASDLLHSAIRRAKSTLSDDPCHEKAGDWSGDESFLPTSSSSLIAMEGPVKSTRYRGNPAITNTALAHVLWSSILRPNVDSAIDATCGNGFDSVVIAQMLFDTYSGGMQKEDECTSQLLCIDIQEQACENTTKALVKELGEEILLRDRIQVLHTSHAPLPRPNDSSSVGLVVYNLGYLPRSDKACMTQIDTTVSSLVDAFLLLRIGGMVSVVTYPKTGPEEDVAVRALLECMALLSSNVMTWKEYVEQELQTSEETKALIKSAMHRVTKEGDPNQTWRVSEHKKLGMDRAPILLTATRIK